MNKCPIMWSSIQGWARYSQEHISVRTSMLQNVTMAQTLVDILA